MNNSKLFNLKFNKCVEYVTVEYRTFELGTVRLWSSTDTCLVPSSSVEYGTVRISDGAGSTISGN